LQPKYHRGELDLLMIIGIKTQKQVNPETLLVGCLIPNYSNHRVHWSDFDEHLDRAAMLNNIVEYHDDIETIRALT
jgi:hypothetical protein